MPEKKKSYKEIREEQRLRDEAERRPSLILPDEVKHPLFNLFLICHKASLCELFISLGQEAITVSLKIISNIAQLSYIIHVLLIYEARLLISWQYLMWMGTWLVKCRARSLLSTKNILPFHVELNYQHVKVSVVGSERKLLGHNWCIKMISFLLTKL